MAEDRREKRVEKRVREEKKKRPGARARKKAAKARQSAALSPLPPAASAPDLAEHKEAVGSNSDGDGARVCRPERYAFEACDADHAETPRLAYEHLAPILVQLAAQLGKGAADLAIYDPFYCAGSVVRHLNALGFARVHNANEDFYARVRARDLPAFDVLVTNPPYTVDHVERLLSFCASIEQPCCLLLPSYVYAKPFFEASAFNAHRPCYLAPRCRYKYRSPPGTMNAAGEKRKSGSGSSGQVTAPFTSFWYLKLPRPASAALQSWWASEASRAAREGACAGCVLARSIAELPHQMRDASDPSRKKLGRGEREEQLAQRRTADGRRLCTACGQVWGNCRHTRG